MFWYGSGGDGWGYVLMGVSMLIFWGLVAAGLVGVFRRTERGGRVGGGLVPAHHGAEQLLAERFARGEIDEAELTSRLGVLRA